MKFDKFRVYTALNADEVKIRSKGYFADNLAQLKELVEADAGTFTVASTQDEEKQYRFYNREEYNPYALFYLVKLPEEKRYRPYRNTEELLQHVDLRKTFTSQIGVCACITAYRDDAVYLSSI